MQLGYVRYHGHHLEHLFLRSENEDCFSRKETEF
jgi:hypothetical protein